MTRPDGGGAAHRQRRNLHHHYTIPLEVVAGDEICDQGFLSGDTSGGAFGHERSEVVCFTVEAETAPAATPPAPEN